MGGDAIREYRRQGPAWKPVAAAGSMFVVGVAAVVLSGVPWWYALVLVAALLLANVWMALTLLRSRTVVRATGITAYGALRERAWTWRDIQDLRVEAAPGQRGATPRQTARLYDTAGQATVLPFLNDRIVRDLHAEVEFLRGLLAGGRGVA